MEPIAPHRKRVKHFLQASIFMTMLATCGPMLSAAADLPVHIATIDMDGKPLANMCVFVWAPGVEASVRTSAEGIAELAIPALPPGELLTAGFMGGSKLPEGVRAGEYMAGLSMIKSKKRGAMRGQYTTRVPADGAACEITLSLYRPVTLRFKCKDSSGKPLSVSAAVGGGFGIAKSNGEGLVVLSGVPANEACNVFVGLGNENIVRHIDPLTADSDLSDMVIPNRPLPDSTIQAKFTDGGPEVSPLAKLGFTAISVDGKAIFSIMRTERPEVPADPEGTLELQVPAGEYFVIPGPFDSTGGFSLWAYEAIAAHQLEPLTSAPRISASKGVTTSVQIRIREIVLKLSKDLAKARDH